MGLFKRITAGILTVALTLGLCAGGAFAAESKEEFILGIYFTSDLYGAWYSVDPNTDKTTSANYLKVATAMERQNQSGDTQLLIDLGNNAQGPIASYTMNMARGETEPIALCLRYTGYDAFLPGSAERTLPLDVRGGLYSALTDTAGTLSGSSVTVLQSKTVTETGEWQEKRTAPFLVRGYPVEDREFRVALVSLETAGNWQELRQSQTCDMVIGVVPSGVPSEGISTILAGTTGIDLVLMNSSGISELITFWDAQGKQVPVVRGRGSALTRVDVSVGKEGAFTVTGSEELSLEKRRNNSNLSALLTPYYEQAKAFGSQVLGIFSGDWPWEVNQATTQSDTMNLLHEIQLWATQADVSIATPQAEDFCIRQLLGDQPFAVADRKTCYSIYPYENDRLLMVEMTGEELKDWLENSAGQYTVAEDGFVTGGEGASQVYGISYLFCLGNPVGDRVVNMTYQGKAVERSQRFRVAVSERSLAAAQANRETYPLLWEAASSENFQEEGGSVTWIIGAYLHSLTSNYKQILPPKPRSHWTITSVTREAALNPVTRLAFVEALNIAAGSPKASALCGSFSDVSRAGPDLTAPSALDWAVETGVVQGNGNGQFFPDTPITREQAAIMLLRFDDSRGKGPKGAWATAVPYTDAASVVSWASEALMWNVLQNYLPPDDGGYFHPQAPVTVIELEQILEKLDQN